MLNYSLLLFAYVFLFRADPSHVPTYLFILFLSLLDYKSALVPFCGPTLQPSRLFTSSFITHSDHLTVLNQHLSLNIGEMR